MELNWNGWWWWWWFLKFDLVAQWVIWWLWQVFFGLWATGEASWFNSRENSWITRSTMLNCCECAEVVGLSLLFANGTATLPVLGYFYVFFSLFFFTNLRFFPPLVWSWAAVLLIPLNFWWVFDGFLVNWFSYDGDGR